ncbi:TorF family putative porin [Pseudomonas sp. NPDC087697]|uniref:TorF family putative porin n=1 Tax=Pseudomonas sp. NPDC087697 TaxID=3364447 RepID=UPI003803711C
MKAANAVIVVLLSLVALRASALPLGNGYDLSLELTAINDYRSKGISQTLGDPAAQAGATLSTPFGLYAGVWGSSVDFGEGTQTRFEQDFYAGWYVPLSDDLSFDLGYIKYVYPKDSLFNQTATYGRLKFHGLELTAAYSDDLLGNQSNLYSYVAYELPLNEKTHLNLRYGLMDYKDDIIQSSSGKGRSRYDEWEVRLYRDYAGLTWSAGLVGTDLSRTECQSLTGYDDLCSANVLIGVSKSF